MEEKTENRRNKGILLIWRKPTLKFLGHKIIESDIETIKITGFKGEKLLTPINLRIISKSEYDKKKEQGEILINIELDELVD